MDKEEIVAWSLGAVGAVQGVSKYYVAPAAQNALKSLTVPENGLYGWAALASGVAVYDYLAMRDGKETLSHAFGRGMEHPFYKFLCVGALGATALHLLKLFPDKIDPFTSGGKL